MTAALLLLLASGCQEAAISGHRVDQYSAPGSGAAAGGALGASETGRRGEAIEQVSWQDEQQLAGALAQGGLELRPERPFDAVYLMAAAKGFASLTYTYERLDGSRSAPLALPLDHDVIDGARARLILPEPARALFIAHAPDGAALTFLAARTYQGVPAEFSAHDDRPGQEGGLGLNGLGALITRSQALAVEGRYQIPQHVADLGDQQSVPYEDAGRVARGHDMEGVVRLARYLKERFPQIVLVEGYNERDNTAGGGLSVHADGRAIDLFIKRDLSVEAPGQADNTLGDPVANWLIANAERIGVTFLIWDRTKWSASQTYASGERHDAYTGTHAHDDHIHFEISSAAGNLMTDFFDDPAQVVDEQGHTDPAPLDPLPLRCVSRHRPTPVSQGECTQGEKQWTDCEWYRCDEWGVFSRVALSECTQQVYGKRERWCPASQGGNGTIAADGVGCESRQVGMTLSPGECVQSEAAQIHCGACSWLVCVRGQGLQCSGKNGVAAAEAACTGQRFEAMACEMTEPEPEPERVNQLVITLEWPENVDLDLSVKEPSGQVISYSHDSMETDGYIQTCDPLRGEVCGRNAPYHEYIYWGTMEGVVAAGAYDISVENFSSSEGSAFTVMVDRYDAQGAVTRVQTFTGSIGARYDANKKFQVEVGTVVVE